MKNNNGLVSKAIAGDKAAFEELYNEYSDKVYFFALRNVGSEDAARDITSETFANAFESIGTLQSEKSFSNWLFSIAYKKCIDHLRVINKNDYYEDSEQLEKLIEYTALDEPVMLPDDYAANKETAEQLKAVVDGMPASLRSAVLLYYYEDMPVSEVAKTLGISENHAKNKLFRARKLLRKKLEKLIGSGAVFAAVPMRNIFHSALSEPYVKGAVASGAQVKSTGLAARLDVVGTASAIAVGVPMMIHKSSGGDYRPEDNNAPQIISESIAESETSSFPENSDLKIIRTDPDAVFYDIDELIQEADVIMIGEYFEEGRSTNGMTFNTLKAIKVFKGEDKLENGTLPIYECYAYSTDPEGNKQLRLDTCYVPMHKGDKAIFVLGYNEYQKSYGPFEYEGRFPLPEDLGKKDDLGFTNGVLKEEQFNKEIYDQLLERFNISEEDNYENNTEHKAIEINEPYYTSLKKLSAASKGIIEGRITGSHKELIDDRDGAVVSETDTDIKNNECVFPYTVYDVEITKAYKGEFGDNKAVGVKTLGNDSVEFENAVDLETGKSYLFFIDYFDNYSDKYPAWLVSSTQSIYEKNNNKYTPLFDSNKVQVTRNMLLKGISDTADLELHDNEINEYSYNDADRIIEKAYNQSKRFGRTVVIADEYANGIFDGTTDKNSLEAKSFVYHMMLNSIDYFNTAEGSLLYKTFSNNTDCEFSFQLDMENHKSYETTSQNGVLLSEDYIENLIRYHVSHKWKKYYKSYIAESVEYNISDNERIVKLEDGSYMTTGRDNITNLGVSGNSCLFPQEIAESELHDFERWEIVDTTEMLGRKCAVIKGTFVHLMVDDTAYPFEAVVDLETGILMEYNDCSSDGTPILSIKVNKLSVDEDIEVKTFDEAEYKGKYEIVDR